MEEVSIFVNFPTIKFTCEMSSERAVFLETEVFKGPRLPPFQYEKGLHLRRSVTSFKNLLSQANTNETLNRLCNRSYPPTFVHKILTEVKFSDRTEAFRNKTKKAKENLTVCYHL